MAMSTPTYPTLPGGHALSPFRAQALLQKLQAIDDAIETLDAEWFYPLEVSAPGPDGALAGERLACLRARSRPGRPRPSTSCTMPALPT